MNETMIGAIGAAVGTLVTALAGAVVYVWNSYKKTKVETQAKEVATKTEADGKSQEQLNAAFVLLVQKLQDTINTNQAAHLDEVKLAREQHANDVRELRGEIKQIQAKAEQDREAAFKAHAACEKENAELRGEVRANALRANQHAVVLAKLEQERLAQAAAPGAPK